jgi:hypothetical protein
MCDADEDREAVRVSEGVWAVMGHESPDPIR